jgi:hypothetical protein
MGKLLFVLGLALGYVLGSRAGRGSYDRLKSRAERIAHDPRVQQGVHDAGEFVKENAPVAAAKIKDVTADATAAVKDKLSKDD